jgi:hypothetical protein
MLELDWGSRGPGFKADGRAEGISLSGKCLRVDTKLDTNLVVSSGLSAAIRTWKIELPSQGHATDPFRLSRRHRPT